MSRIQKLFELFSALYWHLVILTPYPISLSQFFFVRPVSIYITQINILGRLAHQGRTPRDNLVGLLGIRTKA